MGALAELLGQKYILHFAAIIAVACVHDNFVTLAPLSDPPFT